MQFRQIEFHGALSALLGREVPSGTITFTDALSYHGAADLHEIKLVRFNQAMQYVHIENDDIPEWSLAAATQRCALVHALYKIVAESDSYSNVAKLAIDNGGFLDMTPGNENASASWCLRARHYGDHADTKKEYRHSGRTRSLSVEKQALLDLKPLLLTFGGKVDLEKPDCKIYVFDGLVSGQKVLTRRMAQGPQISVIAPNSRICITNTPLCPIASFLLCNIAGVRPHSRILDPYAGSCAVLLAAAMIDPTCQSVGIEIAHNGIVCRDDIRKDFESRQLVPPVALVRGDSTDDKIRATARDAIGGNPFDFIITDPPYGIRESLGSMTPIEELLKCISKDRAAGTPLLRIGGKLVCFVPSRADEDFVNDVMPTEKQIQDAGLVCELMCEQPLNDNLSRWLVSFICIE